MATFTPYQNGSGDYDNQTFTEPCMHCFASVTYQRKEAVDNPARTGRKYIMCPNCGNVMRVTFTNTCLC